MRAGRLKHRVTIQARSLDTANTYGERTETWSDVATVSAEVRMLSGSEAYRVKQVQPEATVIVMMRYRDDVTSIQQIVFGSRTLHPLSVTPDVRNTTLTLLCREEL